MLPELLELRPKRRPDVAWQKGADDGVLLPRTDGEQELNEAATRIWQLCDGRHTVREIAQALVDEFEVDEETAQRDVAEFVTALLAEGLLVAHGALA